MSRPFQVALVLCGAALFGPRAAVGQTLPSTLHFRLGMLAQSVILGRRDSAGVVRQEPVRRTVVLTTVTECPMPVVVPDRAKSERMPVARVSPASGAIRQVPPGCINPLGPTPGSSTGHATPTP